jgi:catechol 2,3-dioxygenase-like lactoylglutathione lyase family enzyme
MTIGHIELFVRDPAASRDWYQRALEAELVVEQGPFSWIALGGREILLRPGKPARIDQYRATGTAIVLYSDSLESDLSRLRAEGVALSQDDADTCTTFQDPDGHWYQLVETPN